MGLRAVGILFLLLGASLLALPWFGPQFTWIQPQSEQQIAGLWIAGIGIGLFFLGTVVRHFSRKTEVRPNGPMRAAQVPVFNPASGKRRPPVQAVPVSPASVCARCRKPLKPGIKFCPRCGTAVSTGPRLAAGPPARPAAGASPPLMGASPARPLPRRLLPLLLVVAVVGMFLLLAGLAVVRPHPEQASPREHTSPPYPGALPEPPPPPTPRWPVQISRSDEPYLSNISIETGARDADGRIGLRAHAVVHNANGPLRFAVHFRNGNLPLPSLDSQFRDAEGAAAAVTAIPSPSAATSDAAAFIPLAALDLGPADNHLLLLAGLYDGDRAISVAPFFPFTVPLGRFVITRVRIDPRPSNFGGPTSTSCSVSFRALDAQAPMQGQLIIQFKDDRNVYFPGRAHYASAAGRLRVVGDFSLPPGRQALEYENRPISIPQGLTPPGSTAEIALFDPVRGQWLSPQVLVKLP